MQHAALRINQQLEKSKGICGMRRRYFLASGLAAGSSNLFSAPLSPTAGPIRIVVGFAPGGGTDVMARVIAQQLTELWNVPVLIENKPGAGGVIAADYVAKQPANGNVLLMTTASNHVIAPALYPSLPYVAERDFTPLILVGITPNVLVCGVTQKARTLRDVVDLCRAKPGEITFGSAGAGASQHMAFELFKLSAGIDALHVPYRGSSPMLTDLISGRINYSFETMTSAMPHLSTGKLIAIAQSRTQRSKTLAGVPTVNELGYPGFDASSWYGLVGPAHMPEETITRMSDDLNKIMALSQVATKLGSYGAEDGGGSPIKFANFIASEKEKWTKVVRDGKVQV